MTLFKCPACATVVEAPAETPLLGCPGCGFRSPSMAWARIPGQMAAAMAPGGGVAQGTPVSPLHPIPPPPTMPYPQVPMAPGGAPNAKGAVASLVLGIVALLVYVLGLVPAILAIVFGQKAKRRIRESGGTLGGRGLATAGVILGIVWLCLIPVMIILAATVFVLVSDIGAAAVPKVDAFTCDAALEADGYQAFIADDGAFGICYPGAWEAMDVEEVEIAFLSPAAVDDAFRENLNIVKERLPLPMSLDDYVEASIENIEREYDAEVLSVEPRPFAGTTGRVMEHRFRFDYGEVHGFAAIIVDERTAWIATFSAPQESPDAFSEEREAMFDSFRLIG